MTYVLVGVVVKINEVSQIVTSRSSDTTTSYVSWWGPIRAGRQHHIMPP